MKNLDLLAFSTAIMLAMSACSSDSKDEPTPPVVPQQPTEADNGVTFTSTLSDLARATDTSFESGDAISVWAVEPASSTTTTPGTLRSSGNYANNVPFSFDGTHFRPANSKIEKDADKRLNYYAVYPYSSSNGPSFTFTANTDQTSRASYTKSDLCCAATGITSSQVPSLDFAHSMAQLIINCGSSLGNVTSIELQNVYNRASVNLNSWTISYTGTKTKIKMCSNGTRSFKAIIAPQTLMQGTLTAVLTTTSGEVTWKVENNITLGSGKCYIANLELDDDGGEVSFTGSITPWQTL